MGRGRVFGCQRVLSFQVQPTVTVVQRLPWLFCGISCTQPFPEGNVCSQSVIHHGIEALNHMGLVFKFWTKSNLEAVLAHLISCLCEDRHDLQAL